MSAYFTYTKTYLPLSLINDQDATDLLSATQAGFALVDTAITSPTGTVQVAIDASAAATLVTATAATAASEAAAAGSAAIATGAEISSGLNAVSANNSAISAAANAAIAGAYIVPSLVFIPLGVI